MPNSVLHIIKGFMVRTSHNPKSCIDIVFPLPSDLGYSRLTCFERDLDKAPAFIRKELGPGYFPLSPKEEVDV